MCGNSGCGLRGSLQGESTLVSLERERERERDSSIVLNMSTVACSACVVLDRAGDYRGLTLYNLAASTDLVAGSILTLPDPVLRLATVEHNVSITNSASYRLVLPMLWRICHWFRN